MQKVYPDELVGCEDLEHDGGNVAFKEVGVLNAVVKLPGVEGVERWWGRYEGDLEI